MTPAESLTRDIAKETREALRLENIRTKDGRRSYAHGQWQVAVSHRPQIAAHKDLFFRIVEGKRG